MLKTEKEVVEISQSLGMQQGNNIVALVCSSLKTKWKQQEIPIRHIMTASNDNLIHRKVCSHAPAMCTLKNLTANELLQ